MTEAESGLRHLQAEECQGLPAMPEAKRKELNSSFPTAFRRSSSASGEANKEKVEKKNRAIQKGVPRIPMGFRAVTGSDGRKIGKNQTRQGISARLRGLDSVH